jgi:flagellar hook-basal body complex protein FliE
MIIPPIGNVLGGLTGAGEATSAGAQAAGGLVGAAAEGAGAAASATGGTSSTFGSALTEAISSLETSQVNSDAASQALATGKVTDPEQAVSTVEDASLEMELASQIRGKATEALQSIFQTQV